MLRKLALAGLTIMSLGAPAAAEECPPLKMLTSVDLVMSPNGRAPYIPVEIAGIPKLMLLDTGADLTLISEEAANELHLDTRRANLRAYNVTGTYTDKAASVQLKIGTLRGKLAVIVDPNLNWLHSNPDVIGLFGADILSNYDVSVDFGTGKFDLLSQDHCDGKVIYWQAPAVAVVPIKKTDSRSIVVKVELDGKPVKAILDTGAWNSTIRIDAAEKLFGIKPGDADTPATGGGLNHRDDLKTYRHTFKALTFEGVQISNPELTLIPDMLSKKIGSHVPINSLIAVKNEGVEPDMLLGMNILRHLHLYIAYREKNLYITPAGTPVEAKPTAEAPKPRN